MKDENLPRVHGNLPLSCPRLTFLSRTFGGVMLRSICEELFRTDKQDPPRGPLSHRSPLHRDEDLTTLTHVYYRWRKILISCPSLWTCLDCKNVDKTCVYLKRSKASALKIRLGEYLDEAFHLTIPYLGQLGSLSLLGSPDHLLNLTTHFESHAPLLKTLSLTVASTRNLVLQDSIFGGNLSSLHELYLNGVITNLAWEDMSNPRTFDFSYVPSDKIPITQLLHFFEHAPLLRKIRLYEALPDFSDVPLGRMVPLPNLNSLVIRAHQAHTIVTNHSSIPTGATII